MKIAIVSDTHDQADRVIRALDLARERGAEMVIHCGDIVGPEIVELFRGWTAHFVFGNCDWDQAGLKGAIAAIGATCHEDYGHLEIEGVPLAFIHGHDTNLMNDLRTSGAFAYLFHGHTHVAMDRTHGPTRVINPGALQCAAIKTFVVLDTSTGKAESVVVE